MLREKSAYFRRKARVLALQTLYEVDLAGHHQGDSYGRLLEEEAQLPQGSADYAFELVEGVSHRRDEIDTFIHMFAPAWPVTQLPVVDRNILRLALFEICFGQGTPPKVAINEAVELAKSFGSESSARFVNGVLGSVMDSMELAQTESTILPGEQNRQGGK
jgi:N utilization substance protein B